jgi:23S rRNA (cytidine1920-2'-O)/16S rRNA (cytidine1409-2'-O)-methyltransferase
VKKLRLDQALVQRGQVQSRSQAESYIKLGRVKLNGQVVTKPGQAVGSHDEIELVQKELYVSRAGLKLASAAEKFSLDFRKKTVLDVGSSTGGFTDYALRHGVAKVIAVDVGTDQLHPSLRGDDRVELHEKTDIRSFKPSVKPEIVLIDVSFISLKEILPTIAKMSTKKTQIVVLVKPQFEAGKEQINRGVVKNDTIRRKVLAGFEAWAKKQFLITDKADSEVAGARGNRERFYLLKSLT